MLKTVSLLPLTRSRRRSRTMQAMLWHRAGCPMAASVPLPLPREHQLLIRVSGYGLSLHDLKAWQRTAPPHPGAPPAEGWGVVERVGSRVHGFEPGQSVAFITARGFSEYALADAQTALPLPDSLADTPFLLRSVTGVVNLFRRSQMNSGDSVAIVGGGFLGLLTAQLTALAEARTIVVARRECSRRLALTFGAAAALPSDPSAAESVRELTGGRFCDYAIDTGGAAATLQQASELACPRGRLIIAGHHTAPRAVDLPLWSERGLDVINAHEPSPTLTLECMREAVGAVRAGLLTPAPLYTHRFPLTRISDAIACATRRPEGFHKALIHIQPCLTLRSPLPPSGLRAF